MTTGTVESPRTSPAAIVRATTGGIVRRIDLPTSILLVAVVAYGTYLVWLTHDAYFWGDDWTFLLHKGTIPGETVGTLMDPYNGHWSLAHGLTYRALFEVFGMTTYVPWLVVLVGFHVTIVVATFYVLRKARCPRWVAVGTAFAILFTGVGPEMVVYDAAMSHSGALAFGFVALAVALRTDASPRGLTVVALALTLALMWSATGISMVILCGIYLATQHGLAASVRASGPPTLIFVSWFLIWGRDDPAAQSSLGNLANVTNYVWEGLTKVFGTAVGVPDVGPVIFVVLVLSLLTDREASSALRNLAWAGLAAASVQLVLEGVSRLHIGPFDSSPNRYAYFSLVLLSPLLALAMARLLRVTIEPKWLPIAAITVALVGYAAHGVAQVRQYSAGYTSISQAWLDRFQGIIASSDAGQVALMSSYEDRVNGGITQELIASPEVRAVLPAGEATMNDRMLAEMMFNVGVGTESYDLFNPAFIDLSFGWNREIKKMPGCASYVATVPNPMLQIATVDGIEIGITSGATEVITRLVRDDIVADGRIWPVAEGSIHVASTAKDALLQVSFNAPGEYVICKQ